VERDYEPWDRPRLMFDTAGPTEAEALAALRGRIGDRLAMPPAT
jgi:hypothetical protein